ncbi:MAG: 1-acyl-sn-glycerol-3-phosphate acyltransferase [Oscillospiraceae bacterium]|nr:1-acyl-sn-glycerol-3-phosphate acyltransferase [Oscillospiraceae bacterium]
MANEEKKAKKVRTREEENRSYDVFFTMVWLIWFVLYPVKVLHRDRLPEGACIICPNHTSLADPPMAAIAMGRKAYPKIMAKKSLMSLPVLGWIFNRIGTFGVDRGNNDIGAIKNALRALKDNCKLLIFPEGTRVAEDEQGTGKTGAVMFAYKTGAPIVPMFMTRKKRLFRRSVAVFGEPYYLKPAGKRATKEELDTAAEDLMRRIYALEAETK